MKKLKIEIYEPYFFIFFGLFHMHRIWAILDRESYASFWINIMNKKGLFYYTLMGILATLCISGIITFIKNIHHNYWWRWIYIFGGSYVLFDLFAIVTGLDFWKQLLLAMFNTEAGYWNILWTPFIILGCATFILGVTLLKKRRIINFN
ncbi:hypothetical protein [Romboutsia lituseburensis]|uniref:DUF3995 domain-containing protein n=1 Tax=Romboutsia lituseburensis DSM 797 TaxID=1121325 RepID=A0A1G9IQQ7_9FIRM|nr:hypothetical protein [Romboutsia lituseburensis]CEH33801.1 Hypothetical protein RLITU_1207 [Romboutsia lituseburensis]SDL27395.1 hypothetical protein SAMN04515677_101340 [Romboutsia lituseburensis DSM 797]